MNPTVATTRAVDGAANRLIPNILRWSAALVWLSNVNWKFPPAFGRGEDFCRGLCGSVAAGIANPVAPWSAQMFERFDQQLRPFGWFVLLTEATLAALLISGRFVRIAAVVGAIHSLGIFLAVANAPGQWYWSPLLLVALHLAVLASAPTVRSPAARTMALVTVGYGMVVALAHHGVRLIGDGNTKWSLFDSPDQFPGEFGRNVFPGSIGLGLILVALGLGTVAATSVPGLRWLTAPVVRMAGFGMMFTAVVLIVSYRPDGLGLGLSSRASTACVIAALGLTLAFRPPEPQASPGRR